MEQTQDLGFDFSFLDNRIGGSFGYYHKITDGALLNINPAPSSGFSTVVYNIAKIRNVGMELDLNGYFVRNRTFSWHAALNVASNKSKVLNILADKFSDATDRNALNLGNSIVKEGEPLGLICGRPVVGIIRTEEQLADYKSRFSGSAAYSLWELIFPAVGVGSFEYALDEAGMYYEDVIGRTEADFFGGFTNTLSYNNFTLLAHFTFSYGNQLAYLKDVGDMTMGSLANRSISLIEGNKPGSHYSERPANTYSGNITFLTNRNVYDASYLKLKTLSLSYNVPKKLIKYILASDLQVYVSAGNLFTFTKYPGPDPEVSDAPNSIIGGGRDISSYPTSKNYTFGIRVNF
jgi:outer membrane receptor protein involved in Fe transport